MWHRFSASLVSFSPFLLAGVAMLWVGCAQDGLTEDRVTTELRVSSDGEFLAFVPRELECTTGQRIRLVFQHTGKRIPQNHDWVLVLPGAESAVDGEGTAAGEASGWVPRGDKRVLAATALCGPGSSAAVEFTAPAPGDYPYLCTTPGHAAEMHGVLHVREHSFL